MKISTKGRYALRLMIDLAMQGGGTPVSLKDIAVRQGVSDKYLEQIIAMLNKAGYVKSIRGPQGGYMLTQEPSYYTAGMILRLTEGSLVPVACAEEESICEREGGCGTMELWKRLDDAIKCVVDGVTLAQLLEWQLAKQQDI
ncbi:MAG: Rrf2 family transcriptional regulator [Lachnospiraceae bacterium]|nr:Rrf2 family transcriptional regulator [Lachnospiraceae bacterium]